MQQQFPEKRRMHISQSTIKRRPKKIRLGMLDMVKNLLHFIVKQNCVLHYAHLYWIDWGPVLLMRSEYASMVVTEEGKCIEAHGSDL